MSLNNFLFKEEKETDLYQYKLFAYVFSCIFILGFLFDIVFSKVPVFISCIDLVNILISIASIILFYKKRIGINTVFKLQILAILVNMILSHYINPIDSKKFTDTFLRNAITLGMLVPIYGLFSGKRNIFHIGFVYLFLLISSMVRVSDQFLIDNSPFLILNGIIYSVGVYYILDMLEKMRIKQMNLNSILKNKTDELVLKNSDLEKKNLQISEQTKELAELNATKDKLFSIIAHDLRSPISSIMGFSELLMERSIDKNDKNSKDFISIINSTSRQTLTLLENLLEWTKAQSGQIDFKPVKLEIQPIIATVLDDMNSSASLKGITLNSVVSADIFAFADRNMLLTILRNLLSNAIKFTKTGGNVNIKARKIFGQIEILIEDDGIGMDEADQKKLFDLGVNFTTPGTANERGSGLGLILCKEFIEKNGGKISVESEADKGSKIIFTLPSV